MVNLKSQESLKMLRDYQQAAFEATLSSLRAGKNPVVAMATGSGKSWVIAATVDRFRARGGYSLVVTHSKELVNQNYAVLERYSSAEGVGVYSAGLNCSEVGKYATYGTIQTIFRNLDKLPDHIDAIFIDEAQAVSPIDSDTKMYNALLSKYPNARRIGYSATPYRLDRGLIYGGEGCWFDDLAIEISVLELVKAGYLCPLKGISTEVQLNLKGVRMSNGDYDTSEVDERITEEWLKQVLASAKKLVKGRKQILLFAPTVRVAELAANISTELGIPAEYVHGGDKEREDRLARWEAGEFRLMANCQLLTVGYDNPAIDAIVLLSPTESLGKHIQILGRGTRLHPDKKDCLILDYCSNLSRLGGIAATADFYVEKNGKLEPGSITPRQGQKRAIKKADTIDMVDPMSGGAKDIEVFVKKVSYVIIGSKSQPGKRLVLVNYQSETTDGYPISVNDFVMPEYGGWSREKSENWMKRRGATLPRTAWETHEVCYALPIPRRLVVQRNGKYWNVTKEIM